MGLLKSTATVIVGNEIEKFLDEIKMDHAEACLEIAEDGARIAKEHIKDKTGNLRAHVRASKSKFGDEGGAIVLCDANHAHLVEYGHAKVIKGKKNKGGVEIGTVPPHPFMRPSRNAIASHLEESVAMLVSQKTQE